MSCNSRTNLVLFSGLSSVPSGLTLVPSPDRTLYAKFGITTLSFFQVFSSSVISGVQKLSKEGIVNTETRNGSNRYQNSGGFAIKKGGEVVWRHVSKDAGDMGDYNEARKLLD